MKRSSTSPHLTPELVARWWSHALTAEEVLAASDHVAGCPECQVRLAGDRRPAIARAVDKSLREELDEPSHLTSEQLSRWVDGQLDEVEQKVFLSHFEVCELCRNEAEDLSRFAATLGRPHAWAATVRWGGVAASLAGVGLLVAWMHLHRQGPRAVPVPLPTTASPSADRPQPLAVPTAAVVLVDGSLEVDGAGGVRGVDASWRDEVEAAFRSPELGLPPMVLALARLPERQRAESAAAPPILLAQPRSRIVLEDRPLFRWQGAQAAEYRVEVYDGRFALVAASPVVRRQDWRPETALPRGEDLTWKLVATFAAGNQATYPAPPEPPSVFRIAESDAAQAVADARATGSHLLAGLALWRAGLVEEAAAELDALAHDNPDSAVARRLADSSARAVASLPAR